MFGIYKSLSSALSAVQKEILKARLAHDEYISKTHPPQQEETDHVISVWNADTPKTQSQLKAETKAEAKGKKAAGKQAAKVAKAQAKQKAKQKPDTTSHLEEELTPDLEAENISEPSPETLTAKQ